MCCHEPMDSLLDGSRMPQSSSSGKLKHMRLNIKSDRSIITHCLAFFEAEPRETLTAPSVDMAVVLVSRRE